MANAQSSHVARLTQAERTEISDQRMFEATVELILQHGTAATSLKEVGLRAGYSRGLAGHRFGSKDALFSFVLRRLGEIWLGQLTSVTRGLSGMNAVERAVDQHAQFCIDAPAQVRTFYTLWFEAVNTDTELSVAIQKIHRRRHADVVRWIESDPCIADSVKQEADEIAAQFCASVIGIVYSWLSNTTNVEFTKQLHQGLNRTMVQRLGIA